MRIAVSTDDKRGLDSVVSPHFGRCPHYVLADVADDGITRVEEVDNPFYGRHEPGQVPAFIRSLGADVMLTGGMGRRAILFFQQYGIEAVTGASGAVRHAIDHYRSGQLLGAAPCRESQAHDHGARAGHDAAGAPPGEAGYEADEAGRLREEAEMLRRQLDEVTERLGRLGQDRARKGAS